MSFPYITTSYVNGTSGYFIWSNGFKQQWGKTDVATSDAKITVNLLKSFSNTNYFVLVSAQCNDNEEIAGRIITINKTFQKGSFVIRNNGWTTQYNGVRAYWYACGY